MLLLPLLLLLLPPPLLLLLDDAAVEERRMNKAGLETPRGRLSASSSPVPLRLFSLSVCE